MMLWLKKDYMESHGFLILKAFPEVHCSFSKQNVLQTLQYMQQYPLCAVYQCLYRTMVYVSADERKNRTEDESIHQIFVFLGF